MLLEFMITLLFFFLPVLPFVGLTHMPVQRSCSVVGKHWPSIDRLCEEQATIDDTQGAASGCVTAWTEGRLGTTLVGT